MAKNHGKVVREIVLTCLEPLRRAHLEGKIEGLEAAIRMVKARPDYSGNLLSGPLEETIEQVRRTIIKEAEASYTKGPKE